MKSETGDTGGKTGGDKGRKLEGRDGNELGGGFGGWRTTAKTTVGFSCFVASLAAPFEYRYGYSTCAGERSMYETPANLYVNARSAHGRKDAESSQRSPGIVSPEGHSKVNCYVCG